MSADNSLITGLPPSWHFYGKYSGAWKFVKPFESKKKQKYTSDFVAVKVNREKVIKQPIENFYWLLFIKENDPILCDPAG